LTNVNQYEILLVSDKEVAPAVLIHPEARTKREFS
jgi:hypothetical protein